MASFALLLELAFQVLPVSTSTATGYYTDPLIVTYPPHHRWTVATGWALRNSQVLEANNLGYAAAHDFKSNPRAVALIGDSFVEASMLPASDRPGAQLERALAGARPVFALGSPGTALLDYAERIRYMQERFQVRDFVLLMERGDVLQSLCGSGNVHGPCLDRQTLAPRVETLPPAGWAKRLLRHSALAQYLVGQLKFSPDKFLQALARQPHPVVSVQQPVAESAQQDMASLRVVDTVTATFFARVEPHLRGGGRLVIVLDCDRAALYAGRYAADPARARFIALAREAGAIVVDTEPLVRADLTRSNLKLDVGPYDGHLNSRGVRLYTEAAAAALARR